jgi:hypothetical protein
MSLHFGTLFWFQANQSLLLLVNVAYLISGETTYNNLKSLISTIYRTRGEHANHYTTDVVLIVNT